MADIPSIKSLKTIKDLKQENKAAIYDIVLGKCSEKIIETNKQTDKSFLYFELPTVIIGYPNYNIVDCGEYMAKRLKEKGYKIKIISNKFLYIDWSKSGSGSTSNALQNTSVPTSVQGQGKVPDSTIKETKDLLKKYPNTSEVVFVYTNSAIKKKRKVKKKK
jgi:hypothetical protein